MPDIQLEIRGKIARTAGTPCIVCGNSDYTLLLDFSEEWEAYQAKTVRLVYCRNGRMYCDEFLTDTATVTLPPVYGVTEVAVGVYAGDIETTTPAVIPCARCITDGDPVHDPPAPDIYNKLLAYLQSLLTGGAGKVGATGVCLPGTMELAGMAGVPQNAEEETE